MAVVFKLYELSDRIEQINELLENGAEGLEDTLEALDMAFEEKVESILKLWRSKKLEIEAIKAEEDRLAQRRKSLERESEWLFDYVEREMIRLGREKIKSSLFTVWLQMNAPSVQVVDESIIPPEYFETPAPRLQKSKVLEAFKSGNLVPGVEIRQEKSLRVR
jgi:hypothetical protein